MAIWKLHSPLTEEERAVFRDVDPLFVQLMKNRGLVERQAIRAFLKADFATLHDPNTLPDYEKGIATIVAAVQAKDPIVVHGDYDVDGILGTTILKQALTQLGADVHHFLPDRVKDGYGLSQGSKDAVAAAKAKLLITVDCGIRDAAVIAELEQQGVRVVVVDHHTVADALPLATAVINPKRKDSIYPFPHLCATALAYKVTCGLFATLRGDARLSEQFLDLAAISSIADVVPLVGENRVIVRTGLTRFAKMARPGLAAMLELAGYDLHHVEPFTIGFIIAPRINAAGRIASPLAAFDLINEQDPARAQQLARELHEINLKRQEISTAAFESICEAHNEESAIVFHCSAQWPSGVAGLVAGKLTERYGKPSFVLEQREDGRAVGSARGPVSLDVTAILEEVRELLVVYGGHKQAAGFTVLRENLSDFEKRLGAIVQEHAQGKKLEREFIIDAAITLDQITARLWRFIQQLEPFGSENAEPRFLVRNVTLHSLRAVGKTGAHLKIQVRDASGNRFNGIGFNLADVARRVNQGETVDVVFSLQENEWQGMRNLELRVHDLCASRTTVLLPLQTETVQKV